jgi:type IV pilus assembly protein PilN
MRITLNLATRPYADLRPALKRLRIAMAVLAVVALSLGLGLRALHQKAMVARATEQRVQSQIDAVSRERKGYQDLMQQPANAQLLRQVAVLNQLFDEKTFSWTLAMEDLETVLPGGVQVTALEPVRDKTGTITLHLRVVGPRDRAVDLVQNLERSRYFVFPRIVGESTESTGGPNERLEPVSASNRVNFDLLVDYNSAAPMERRAQRKPEKSMGSEGSHAQVTARHSAGVKVLPLQGQARPPVQVQNGVPNGLPANANPVLNRNQYRNFHPNPNPIPNPIPNQGGPR